MRRLDQALPRPPPVGFDAAGERGRQDDAPHLVQSTLDIRLEAGVCGGGARTRPERPQGDSVPCTGCPLCSKT